MDFNEDEREEDFQEAEEEENELERLGNSLQQKTVWALGGSAKLAVITKLIKYFGSLVIRKVYNDEDSAYGPLIKHEKAPNASLNVLRARV